MAKQKPQLSEIGQNQQPKIASKIMPEAPEPLIRSRKESPRVPLRDTGKTEGRVAPGQEERSVVRYLQGKKQSNQGKVSRALAARREGVEKVFGEKLRKPLFDKRIVKPQRPTDEGMRQKIQARKGQQPDTVANYQAREPEFVRGPQRQMENPIEGLKEIQQDLREGLMNLDKQEFMQKMSQRERLNLKLQYIFSYAMTTKLADLIRPTHRVSTDGSGEGLAKAFGMRLLRQFFHKTGIHFFGGD